MNKPLTTMNNPVTIPRSPLGANIEEAAAIKREMTNLLRELEETATGRPVTQPGTWRHKQPKQPKQHKQPEA